MIMKSLVMKRLTNTTTLSSSPMDQLAAVFQAELYFHFPPRTL